MTTATAEEGFWVHYDPWRNEWIDKLGVGHYDTSNQYTVHGCNGSCSRKDFPGKNTSRAEARAKAIQLGIHARMSDTVQPWEINL